MKKQNIVVVVVVVVLVVLGYVWYFKTHNAETESTPSPTEQVQPNK
jgi:Tfp pilus assembly protein PilO